MNKVQDLYDARIKPMLPAERLQLAKLIIDNLAPRESTVDISDEWGDDDLAEAAAYSARQGGHLPDERPSADAGKRP